MKMQILFFWIWVLLPCSSVISQVLSDRPNQETKDLEAWSVPRDQVLEGGPGKDGIQALQNPIFLKAHDAYPTLSDTDLVLGYKHGDDIRAYPHMILDWHEIVNDNVGTVSLAVTYCPLTGTGIGWNRILNGKETTFGVSGLLYQTNLVAFDRATESNWSQILSTSVNGNLIGRKADLIPLVETDWKTWRKMFPETKIVSLTTGYHNAYGSYPYGPYRTDGDLFLFPTPKDKRLPSKERVHAITNGGEAKVYRFGDFESSNLIRDTFNGEEYLIVGNIHFIVSFKLDPSQSTSDFKYVFNGNDEHLVGDENGNQWNIFGEIISGNAAPLVVSSSFMGYWFSIPAFYETEVFTRNKK